MIQQYQQQEQKKESEQKPDPLFYKLASFMFSENYCKRRKPFSRVKEGQEDHNLVGVLFCTQPNAGNYCRKDISFRNFDSMDSLLQKVISEQREDGGYVLDGQSLSDKVYFRTDTAIMKKFNLDEQGIDIFLEKKLPFDFTYLTGEDGLVKKKAGTKTRTAVSMGLLGNSGSTYLIRQTSYDGTSIGKLVQFGKNGLEKEFFMLKTDTPVESDFYFDSKEKVIGVVRDFAEQAVYYVKPAELDNFVKNKEELKLYTPTEALPKEPVDANNYSFNLNTLYKCFNYFVNTIDKINEVFTFN
jgi:hypothetical protein